MSVAVSCVSVESAYTSGQGVGCPTGWGDYGESALHAIGIRREVDLSDALLLNRAYLGLTERQRNAIKWVYFFRHWQMSWIARKLGCGKSEIAEKVAGARLAMSNRVDQLESKAYKSARLPRETVSCPMGG